MNQQLLAVLDASDTVVARFEYAGGRMPVARMQGGETYPFTARVGGRMPLSGPLPQLARDRPAITHREKTGCRAGSGCAEAGIRHARQGTGTLPGKQAGGNVRSVDAASCRVLGAFG
mgnify:CR=1 FL=1